jgi:mannitol 2-dehydrogenase
VHDWELYKLRMLNASHSCIAYLMALADVVYVDEAVAIPVVRRFLEQLLANEAIPTLVEIPGHPADEYADSVLRRFANTGVRDRIARLCIDGTAKFSSFLIPTAEAQIERGGPVACAALTLAAWARYLATIPAAARAPDSRGERAAALAQRSLIDPLAFLELEDVFTQPLRQSARFRDAFAADAAALETLGPLGAIENALEYVLRTHRTDTNSHCRLCRGGEEVDQQLVDAFRLVVMHPVRRVGQALHAVEVGYVVVVGLG